MYSRSVFVWFVVGGFFGDGLYFAISKIYESRFNGSHRQRSYQLTGNDSNLLIVFYVQIMPDDFVMQLHRF